MRKIIGGHKFDTATSPVVRKWSNGIPSGSPGWTRETLHKKKRMGGFFVHVESSVGEIIKPLEDDEALQWLEERFPKEHSKIMEEVNAESATTSYRLTQTAREKLKRDAKALNISQSALIEKLIFEYRPSK